MNFIEYKFLAANGEDNCRRLQYLIDEFSLDKSITTAEFARRINDAYYKYGAPLYSPGYELTLRAAFARFLKPLPQGWDIVDIGAGTGASFRILEDIGYRYRKYYFIEPSADMFRRFVPPPVAEGSSLEMFNGPLEAVTLERQYPKVFIASAVLRAIVNLDEFLADLKGKMKSGDVLLLPLEPNNGSFRPRTISNVSSAFHARTFGHFNRVAAAIRRSLVPARQAGTISIGHLEQSRRYLVENGIVSSSFTQQHLYAVVYYHNYRWWRSLDVPDERSEGFFTPAGLARALDATISRFESFKFFQFESANRIGSWFDTCAGKLLPNSAAYFSALYTKN